MQRMSNNLHQRCTMRRWTKPKTCRHWFHPKRRHRRNSALRVSEDDQNLDGVDADESGEIPVDFNLFVLSLNTSTLIHLGEAPDADGSTRVNLPMARHSIDMLCMLEQKTRGNLTGEEERLLHQVLFDLRMRYANKAGTQR